MIGTEFLKGQGLGNQLFCYITARCIAKERGCAFGTAGQEQLAVNIHSKKGMYFMDLDLGERICLPSSRLRRYEEKELRFYQNTSLHDMEHGCYVAGADEALHSLPDDTLIYGNMQAESYFSRYREEIKEWLKVKEEYDTHEFTRDNLCILNVRGGEYTGNPELYLERRYWMNAMKNMREIRRDMEFIVVTDDPEAAAKLLPGLPVYHSDLDRDYVMLKNARYLILSNSSFAFSRPIPRIPFGLPSRPNTGPGITFPMAIGLLSRIFTAFFIIRIVPDGCLRRRNADGSWKNINAALPVTAGQADRPDRTFRRGRETAP